MKNIFKSIIVTAAALLPIVGSAGPPAQLTAQECQAVQRTTESIMNIRQSNYPMSDLMGEFSGEGQGYVRKAILEAYERPYFKDQRLAQNEVEEFSNKWTLRCYQLLEQTSDS